MKKRSLILAGGGIKVAFQAGVLEVWLDEAGIAFDHVDAASGGVFNLAMLCQGMSGKAVADNWRNLHPSSGIHINPALFPKLFYAESLFTLENYRRNVFTAWKLDWELIQHSRLNATFNIYNFSKHELTVLEPREMTEDHLVACVSLPMWFPPVRIQNDLYIDSVFLSDANIEEAIRRGADELWVIWTVSDKSEWHPGFIGTYFQIIETAAVGHYRAIRRRIEDNNRAIAQGRHGEFERHIEVKELKAEVPLHYLIDFSQDRVAEAVNLGVERARDWCRAQNLPLRKEGPSYPRFVHEAKTTLRFTETMRGHILPGELDFLAADHKQKDRDSLTATFTITVEGVNRFITTPEHEASIRGSIHSDLFGGERMVEDGSFNLFVHENDPSEKQMRYRVHFRDAANRPLTFSGHKNIQDDPGNDVWSDTTTLFTRILSGHLTEADIQQTEKDAKLLKERTVASGIIRIHMLDFLKQLTTFRVEGPSLSDKAAALSRFGRLFLGKLWDVYARDVLSSGPF